MNYKRKRVKAGISAYTMSKELGIDYEKYLMVEKKLIPLEGEYINEFMKILDRAKEILFNRKQRIHEIEESIKDGSLKELANKRGYSGKQLAEALNISPSEVSRTFTGKQTNQATLERIYDFLQDPINVNIESGQKVEEPVVEEVIEEVEEVAKPIVTTFKFAPDGVYIGNTDKDYFEILKENHELEEKLAKAEHQIMMYEKLIERL